MRCLFVLALGIGFYAAAQQRTGGEISYEDRNQIDPQPLKLHSIRGFASDDEGVAVPVVVGIFTEKDHLLVSSARAGVDGKFDFKDIPPGRYRIVAMLDGLCPANVPILVESGSAWISKRIVHLHIRPRGIDTCSFGDLR
jgi:hypothetical protein